MQEHIGQVRSVMKPVAMALESLSVPYVVVGSVAAMSHGYSRMTMDIDTVAQMKPEVVGEFVRQLQDDYYVEAADVRDAIAHRRSFNMICNATGWKIDVFIPEDNEWNTLVTRRREPESLDEGKSAFFVQSIEDLVLSKLRWFRMTNETSDRQWSDIQGVLKFHQLNVDFDYLERWALELDVADLLERALDNAGLRNLE